MDHTAVTGRTCHRTPNRHTRAIGEAAATAALAGTVELMSMIRPTPSTATRVDMASMLRSVTALVDESTVAYLATVEHPDRDLERV